MAPTLGKAADEEANTLAGSALANGPAESTFNIAITGFGPYVDAPVNPSWQCLLPLQDKGTLETPGGKHMKLHTFEIPTVYEEVLRRVPALHIPLSDPLSTSAPGLQPSLAPYDLVVHVGVSPSLNYVSIETGARRYGYEGEDFANKKARSSTVPSTGELVSGFVEAEWAVDKDGWLKSHVDIPKLAARVTQSRIAGIHVSNDAGLYLCEFLYFSSMAHAERAAQRTRSPPKPVVFVHVPMPTHGEFPLSRLTQILLAIVAEIVDSF